MESVSIPRNYLKGSIFGYSINNDMINLPVFIIFILRYYILFNIFIADIIAGLSGGDIALLPSG
ncbi:hypothetical protein GCM10009131_20440 [Morganella psychrotolerans]